MQNTLANLGHQSGSVIAARRRHSLRPSLPHGPQILVVEHDLQSNRGICQVLEAKGYNVRSALSGDNALQLLNQTIPDLILCNIMLPGMDGYSLLQHSRTDERLRTVPFVFLTDQSTTTNRRAAKAIGGEDCLSLPVDDADLIDTVASILRKKQLLQDELQQRMDILSDRILGLVQHEFRTPLTFVLGYAEFLRDALNEDLDRDEIQMSVDAILEGGRRLHHLVENFILLTSLNDRQIRGDEIHSCNALALWREIYEMAKDDLKKTGLAVEISAQNESLTARCDTQLMREALGRLLENAIRYRRTDSQTIWLAVEKRPGFVGWTIQDEGLGIPAEQLQEIVNPFVRIRDHQGSQHGMGLGLAVVNRIVELHDGELTIDSAEGQGSAFTLWVPR